ncbi:MAG TPA: hypothetical protein VMO26_12770 [Vicinamibacterales bacterium]|nr:hypothetical protein [Vicinamibacterales bacterium]
MATLDGIARGEITLAFRRWRRPTVRSGGTLLTGSGRLQIRTVAVVHVDDITVEDARRAGYDSREALLRELARSADGDLYRIELGQIEADPRIALRESSLDSRAADELHARLVRLDRASPVGPWTLKTLQAIRDNPGLRAGDLCQLVGQDRDRFKPNVRKLKNLGLTISLEVGYRLSSRGAAYLELAISPSVVDEGDIP